MLASGSLDSDIHGGLQRFRSVECLRMREMPIGMDSRCHPAFKPGQLELDRMALP